MKNKISCPFQEQEIENELDFYSESEQKNINLNAQERIFVEKIKLVEKNTIIYNQSIISLINEIDFNLKQIKEAKYLKGSYH